MSSKPRFVGEKVKLGDVCDVLNGFAFKSRQYVDKGIRIIRIANVQKGYLEDSKPCFYPVKLTDSLKQYILEENDLLVSLTGNVGRVALLEKSFLPAALNQRVACLRIKDESRICKRYLYHALNSSLFENNCVESANGIAQKNMSTTWLKGYRIPAPSMVEQEIIIKQLDLIQRQISNVKRQLSEFDSLVKSRFVEIFGDLKLNKYNWPIEPFESFAVIDTHMANNLDAYANKPHIGIDSIESNSGRLSGYRTVAEDGIISGKYPFTAQHIIYSKIRPALNKVALPDFDGVCSADAYPILPAKERCNRIYLAQVMRSSYFLDYVLPLSGRAQMPKVNKKALQGFSMPLPPLELQQEFATFVSQVDKSRFIAQQQIEKLQMLYDSLAQDYFGD